MAMPVTLRRFTVADLETFPDDGNRYELLDGVLFVTPVPLPPHEALIQRLMLLLGNHLSPWPEVWLAPRSEVVLAPDNKLEPDLQVYRAPSLPRSWADVEERWLVVEVASRSTRIYDREYKRDGYLQLGVREVWLVDRFDRAVRVTTHQTRAEATHRTPFLWTPPAPVPPLPIDPVELFRDLPTEV
jgi:Uma2 family endonuclease